MLTLDGWVRVPGLRHGFLDRHDSADDVTAGLPLVLPRQVHGTTVAVAPVGERPEADAVVTGSPGLLVGVVTADCVPVLLVDRRRKLAAAVHAGWRGAAAGVLEAAVERLAELFGSEPSALEAAIGPAIGGCCYEVGPEVRAAFEARTGRVIDSAWLPGPRREHVDLRIAARCLLAAAGVGAIAILGGCTACDASHHSYRRDGARVGRQLSFVGWS